MAVDKKPLPKLDMATKHTDDHGTDFYTDAEGNKIYVRRCFKVGKHDAHRHTSYWFAAKPAQDNAYCPGDGISNAVGSDNPYRADWHSSSYKPKVKKDYSTDAENFPVSDVLSVSQARKIAFDMHKDQKDKAGHPYSEHLAAVEMGVRVLGGSNEERIAALFHDAVEDHHTTYALLKKINVTDETLVMIEAVSKRGGEKQTVYLDRIKNAGNTIPKDLADVGVEKENIDSERTSAGAKRVKLADLFHNTRHDRIQALRDAKRNDTADRLLKKYRPAMAALMLDLGMIITEDEQTKIATKPQGTATGTYSGYTGSYNPSTTKKQEDYRIEVSSLMEGDVIKKDSYVGAHKVPKDSKITGLEVLEPEKAGGLPTTLITVEGAITYPVKWTEKNGTWPKIAVRSMAGVKVEKKKKPKPKDSSTKNSAVDWEAYQLLGGDWIEGANAPILSGVPEGVMEEGPCDLILFNGEVHTVAHPEAIVRVYTVQNWRKDYTALYWLDEAEVQQWDDRLMEVMENEVMPTEVWTDEEDEHAGILSLWGE